MRVLHEHAVQEMDSKALLAALTALQKGDFTVRLPIEWTGIAGKVADTFNEVVALNERMAKELDRVSRVVGIEGKLNQRASLGDVGGSWRKSVRGVNARTTTWSNPPAKTPA